jgi:hypothetical protein
MSTITPREREDWRELHTDPVERYCWICRENEPCTGLRLLDALDAANSDIVNFIDKVEYDIGVIHDLRLRLHDAEVRADVAEERLAIQIDTNLALQEVVNELELRVQDVAEQKEGLADDDHDGNRGSVYPGAGAGASLAV